MYQSQTAYNEQVTHRPGWLITAAVVLLSVWLQALSPFLMPAHGLGDAGGRTLALCTADGYKLVRLDGAAGNGTSDETASVLHCPLCLGAQQMAAVLPPSVVIVPVFYPVSIAYVPAIVAVPSLASETGWAESRAPPSIG
ncbi:MAG: DUF2946 family protein [Alphaproteobacteria bacterium]|nr:DUF2946 family protein [Alphaproteobacteria bacterium]MBU0798173.1 DUF2946 family protein [Alphaproteobacteria bacterium]MBU0887608.1 DUF2946 family protein [Alphaproteobacteria bacterium]MBU1814260.1 DUF2946 family protein [Alphaproteobacteria bacterium]MBU2091001.1 DUF2946 family protein [Alphaproteobacteria bacterium]